MDFILEPMYLIPNLTVFSGILWTLLPQETENFLEKLKVLGIYGLFYCFLYLFFFTQRNSITGFFLWKHLFFSHWYLLFLLIFGSGIFFLVKKNLSLFWQIFVPLLSFALFFLCFGQEKFQFFSWKFGSLGFLKSQNPILWMIGFPLFWIPYYKIRIPIFLILGIGLVVHTGNKKEKLMEKLEESRFYRYIPAESFFSGNAILREEEMGVYHFIRPVEVEEPIYKFTMKPLRKLVLSERRLIQEIVDRFEFPILIKRDNQVFIYELSRSFKGSTLQVIYSIDTGHVKLEGPLF